MRCFQPNTRERAAVVWLVAVPGRTLTPWRHQKCPGRRGPVGSTGPDRLMRTLSKPWIGA